MASTRPEAAKLPLIDRMPGDFEAAPEPFTGKAEVPTEIPNLVRQRLGLLADGVVAEERDHAWPEPRLRLQDDPSLPIAPVGGMEADLPRRLFLGQP